MNSDINEFADWPSPVQTAHLTCNIEILGRSCQLVSILLLSYPRVVPVGHLADRMPFLIRASSISFSKTLPFVQQK